MNKKTLPKVSGIALAIAAAGLVSGASPTVQAKGDTTDLVHCYGVNVCKGHNDCGGKSNSCKGHGSC